MADTSTVAVSPMAEPVAETGREEQEHEASLLGMWTFLATEVLFFGGLIVAFLVYRAAYTPVFREASTHLNVLLGTVNTAVLLTSSLTMALAVDAAARRQRQRLVWLLLATAGLGLVFLGIKAVEYSLEFREHLFPGPGFVWEGDQGNVAQLFFVLYFVMTGLHALHLILGIGAVGVMSWLAHRGWYDESPTPVEVLGLYWHFIDIVWIFLFPLLYLLRH
ncbi:MAG: cytochrome c oxidase subunit III [Litorilinea sp.]|nr:MAG: cytochrome c oxidase subunit III [Litorilinea sp.]